MTERPIPFTGEMVRAILFNDKTQTRRPLKFPIGGDVVGFQFSIDNTLYMEHLSGVRTYRPRACQYGVPGDHLWVKETFANAPKGEYVYRANYKSGHGQEVVDLNSGITIPLVWKSSRFMPKLASRITLEIVNVRVERLKEITANDLIAEGFHALEHEFIPLWNSINAKRGYGWNENPWVWVIEFKRI